MDMVLRHIHSFFVAFKKSSTIVAVCGVVIGFAKWRVWGGSLRFDMVNCGEIELLGVVVFGCCRLVGWQYAQKTLCDFYSLAGIKN